MKPLRRNVQYEGTKRPLQFCMGQEADEIFLKSVLTHCILLLAYYTILL